MDFVTADKFDKDANVSDGPTVHGKYTPHQTLGY